jgi:hypothetical protein
VNMQVVRNFGSDRTHVQDIASTYRAHAFGVDYTAPSAGRAACGVRIGDGVVMRSGSKVRCSACRHITGVTEQVAPTAQPRPTSHAATDATPPTSSPPAPPPSP